MQKMSKESKIATINKLISHYVDSISHDCLVGAILFNNSNISTMFPSYVFTCFNDFGTTLSSVVSGLNMT